MSRQTAPVPAGSHPRFSLAEGWTPAAGRRLRELAGRFRLAWLPPLTRYGELSATHPRLPAGRAPGFGHFHHPVGKTYAGDDFLSAFGEPPAAVGGHWGRAEFDQFFAARAVAAGAILFDRTTVRSLLTRPPTTGRHAARFELKAFRARGPDEPPGPPAPVTVEAGFLIDAGPPGGSLRELLGLPDRTADVRTRTAGTFGRVRDLEPWESVLDALGLDRGSHPFPAGQGAVNQALADGWCGELRLDGGKTQLARVYRIDGQPSPFVAADPFGLKSAPTLAGRFSATHFRSDATSVRTGRLQRRTGRIVGGGYALLPAAAGFVAPLHAAAGARTAGGVLRLCTALSGHWGTAALPAALTGYAAAVDRELDREDALTAPCVDALGDWPRFRRSLVPRFLAETAGPGAGCLLTDDPAFAAAATSYFTRLAAGDGTGLDDDLRRIMEPWERGHPPASPSA